MFWLLSPRSTAMPFGTRFGGRIERGKREQFGRRRALRAMESNFAGAARMRWAQPRTATSVGGRTEWLDQFVDFFKLARWAANSWSLTQPSK